MHILSKLAKLYLAYEISANKLPIAVRRDICDPLLELSSSLLLNKLSLMSAFENLKIEISDPLLPPWGLNIEVPSPLVEFLKNGSALLIDLQRALFDEYKLASNFILGYENSEANYDKSWPNLPERSFRLLQALQYSIKPSEAVKPELQFTKGCAVTYTLYETENHRTIISVHPRLMSKGNSADAMGIYVDNFEGERISDRKKKLKLYENILANLAMKREIQTGAFLVKGEKL